MSTTPTAFAGSVWTSPHASKHALLIHGLTSSSQAWYSVANELAARGYQATAPDLLGHGNARRGTAYTIAALADELRPFVAGVHGSEFPGYDLIIGHSLGALVTLAFLSLIPEDKPVRVILIDPPLEIASGNDQFLHGLFIDQITKPLIVEQFCALRPRWSRKDAAWEVLGNHLCGTDVIDAIFEQNGNPWSYTHKLDTIPPQVTLKILAADPSLGALCKAEEAPGFVEVVPGAAHSIQREDLEVVIKAAVPDGPSNISDTLAASVWGSPQSTKHALLIHGLTCSSASIWFRIAPELVKNGYKVSAPDYHGHGIAQSGTEYQISALAATLRPLFTKTPTFSGYDLVIGHSLGGLITLSLLSLIGATDKLVRVVVIDPPLEQDAALVAHFRKMFVEFVTNVRPAETVAGENPLWTRDDVAWHTLSEELCDPAAVEAVFEQNDPWTFGHLLANVPPNIELIVMGADISLLPSFRVEEAIPYPHVKTRVVEGATHMIPREFPDVVVETALHGVPK
ncbi:Alpha/Beta hydrolase protein [Hygrophoropsis aurantiaca]|uniref:Alpha/Beta hydrolase protein n=1 Tax=Hygrophoropsis aurantiaca TaxID=72124 RepID=A0ACB8ARD5_9AGAM|nr:Alpha/Beta hydrolase protein [Hygrophoropsis aurantiaca]